MSQARLQKRARLLRAIEFRHVFDDPVRSRDRYFTVLARKNKVGNARLGLAISKKNARLAVTRNRIKRVIRESFRTSDDTIDNDYVVMTTVAGAKTDNLKLTRSLEQHWQTIRSRCESC